MKIQNYVIYRKTIGAGSMGKVKLAECLTDVHKQKYAVKIMPKVDLGSIPASAKPKDPKDTPEEREQRTIREMAIMRLLRHPNICQLKEYITEGDKYYMFLEYVDGGQLLDYIIKHGKLREKQARKFARQIVSALDYCHRNSIVHRDLKIENILITQSEQLKIIDFGLSNVYSPTQQLNTFCGSLYFAAPELLRAKQYTGPEVDVWSFGVVLYVLVCGRVPFDDTNLPALHEKIKSGVVEDYPDHLGKDCLDLLSKIFVVDPSRRITLSAIQSHPWMNKGYEEPIRNYLPHRQPLEHIDMDIVNGMDGFGLGTPQEIAEKLQKIISSAAYQTAALKIDQNFQKKASDDQSLANKPRWRRTLSTRKKTVMQDDFQSLPAMYDPLVSIYYLVKERRESDQRKKQLLEAEPNPLALSRSTSTLVVSRLTSNSTGTNSNATNTRGSSPPLSGATPSLTRRRTFDTSKKLPDLPSLNKTSTREPNTPIPSASLSRSEKVKSTTTLIRKKSLQAVRKFGIKLPGSVHQELSPRASADDATPTPQNASKKASNTSIIDSSASSSATTTTSNTATDHHGVTKKSTSTTSIPSTSPRKSNWLKLELNNQQPQQKRQSTNSTSSTTATTTTANNRPTWRKLSISKKSTRHSMDQSTGNLPTPADTMLMEKTNKIDAPIKKSNSAMSTTQCNGHDLSSQQQQQQQHQAPPKIVMETSKSELIQSSSSSRKKSISSNPKSLFHFNRGHLIRITPTQMMTDLVHVLEQLDIDILAKEQFQFHCRCAYPVWSKYLQDGHNSNSDRAHNSNQHGDLKFLVMIYEARWAGGKMGIKVKDTDDGNFYTKQVLRNIYHAILSDVNRIQKRSSSS
ncbi:CAMK/CAMKL/KIN1 protein kinase [Mucor circinelloides 1006PhL]|uniref:non-specific serine/threonine protein kinase n=1 Tax=Mucor circinelloides f. circinelloides (strain 1006PhL) TaxID=1220926 RepID=S2JK02_MUCC1|nr:CAMK/CAMKL/KIN1 protein kinase [Mucor circinelloides 1006PhL]